MVLDAIDEYLDPLTENFGNHEYQLLGTKIRRTIRNSQ